MKKILTISVILLFIGIAISPSINASVVMDDLVEFDVEYCGLSKNYTVQLTQQEADEVELLFDDIEQKLSKIETREETEVLFKELLVGLDKYGLLGDFSVEQTYCLITGKFVQSTKIWSQINDIFPNYISSKYNFLALVYGHSEWGLFQSPVSILVTIFGLLAMAILYSGLIIGPFLLLMLLIFDNNPYFSFFKNLCILNVGVILEGYVFSAGLGGIHENNSGIFIGFTGYRIYVQDEIFKFFGFCPLLEI